jgi:predicted CXXCH cytochrome family protein
VRSRLRHAKHLIMLLAVFLAAVTSFLVLRRWVVPEGFGRYGHYRAPAVDEVRLTPVSFAGGSVCADCHTDVVEAREAAKHRLVSCESCHGPLASHAADPSIKPARPGETALCVRCHERDAAKPAGFPQVSSREHSGGEACGSCHNPHRPAM